MPRPPIHGPTFPSWLRMETEVEPSDECIPPCKGPGDVIRGFALFGFGTGVLERGICNEKFLFLRPNVNSFMQGGVWDEMNVRRMTNSRLIVQSGLSSRGPADVYIDSHLSTPICFLILILSILLPYPSILLPHPSILIPPFSYSLSLYKYYHSILWASSHSRL